MANEMMKTVSYETALGNVQIDAETVKQYLVKGNGEVSDQEVFLFIKMCEAQKLNPFVTGEVYLIKFGTAPAQMVIGYDTYKRRAEENPSHLYTESGIVVSRGSNGEIVQKAGACIYPTETLIGGWCRVHKLRNGKEVTVFKEVGVAEYNTGKSIWKEKPCTMIEKVAISQCLREAYPKDYEGLYTEEEVSPQSPPENSTGEKKTFVPATVEENIITQAERRELFGKAREFFGKDGGNDVIKDLLNEIGLQSTAEMTKEQYAVISEKLDERIFEKQKAETADNQ